jgi:hypothetical protein
MHMRIHTVCCLYIIYTVVARGIFCVCCWPWPTDRQYSSTSPTIFLNNNFRVPTVVVLDQHILQQVPDRQLTAGDVCIFLYFIFSVNLSAAYIYPRGKNNAEVDPALQYTLELCSSCLFELGHAVGIHCQRNTLTPSISWIVSECRSPSNASLFRFSLVNTLVSFDYRRKHHNDHSEWYFSDLNGQS